MKRSWQTWINLAAAVWLYLYPVFAGENMTDNPSAVVAWVSATLLLASSFEALAFPLTERDWLPLGIAGVLIAAPWLLSYAPAAAACSVAAGVTIACVDLVRGAGRRARTTPTE